MKEQVNHPAHYQKNGKECIDVMIEKYGVQATIHFCKLNTFKYEWRAGEKEGNSKEQDLKKAEWYRNKAGELRGIGIFKRIVMLLNRRIKADRHMV